MTTHQAFKPQYMYLHKNSPDWENLTKNQSFLFSDSLAGVCCAIEAINNF